MRRAAKVLFGSWPLGRGGPQRLKPIESSAVAARLKSCPSRTCSNRNFSPLLRGAADGRCAAARCTLGRWTAGGGCPHMSCGTSSDGKENKLSLPALRNKVHSFVIGRHSGLRRPSPRSKRRRTGKATVREHVLIRMRVKVFALRISAWHLLNGTGFMRDHGPAKRRGKVER